MSHADNPYRSTFTLAELAPAHERADFIRKTYAHLGGAVFAFTAIEAALIQTGLGDQMIHALGRSQFGWLIVIGAFMFVSYIADRWARSTTSSAMQYMGLALYVAAEAVIFLPLLTFANSIDTRVIPTAGLATLTVFGGLTALVFLTGKDFSFLRTALWLGGLIAMGFVLCAVFIGFSLGLVFSVAMVALASGYILYDTSNVLHHYRIGQHVAAALALFASVALLFFYIVRIVLSLTSRD
ncbi:MAG TPA: Bax inhibitor-1 family protein [Pirellulales bacterium]|nr:Bax inhibitor-1 family protein [Pirellulales bacterium]